MPDNVVINKLKLDILANSISTKSGEPIPLTITEMTNAVDGIKTIKDDTTPYYMWKDSSNFFHISTAEHSGSIVHASEIEEHHSWSTIYEVTISEWEQTNHCYDYTAPVDLNLIENNTYRVTYDGTVYMLICSLSNDIYRLGSNVFGWDGESQLEYPFGIEDGFRVAYFDVTTDGTHTFKIEHWE